MRQFIFLFFLLILSAQLTHAQEVFPGDADNNGRVEHYDLLHIGYAYGAVGPRRLEEGLDFYGYPISLAWDLSFPDGHNFAFADSDGNGQIDMSDIIAVYLNYGLEHDWPNDVEIAVSPGGDAVQLQFNPTGLTSQLTQGSVLQIPLLLGSEEEPIEDFNGMAFTLSYDKQRIQDISVDFFPEDPDPANGFFYYQSFPEMESGKQEVAITRFGADPVSVAGKIAVVNIVIEDNLIDFMSGNQDSVGVLVQVDQIRLVNGLFEEIPVSGDSLNIMVYHPNAITDVDDPPAQPQIRIFPNPVREELNIQSRINIQKVELLNAFGQEIKTAAGPEGQKIHIPISGLGEGFFILRIYTDGGMITRKVLINGR